MARWGEIKCARCAELEAKLLKCATDLDIYMNAHAALEDRLATLTGSAGTVIEGWDWWHLDERHRKQPLEQAIEELRADLGMKGPSHEH